MLLSYVVKEFLAAKRHQKPIDSTSFYKGFRLYHSTISEKKKGRIRMLLEANRLSRFWQCFPDTYFRFGMFMKDFGDMDLMKTFIPQQAYLRYAQDKDPKYHILIDDKILFHNIMRMYRLPVPERYFVFQDKTFRKDGFVISDVEVDVILSNIQDERIFIKRYRGGAASGISIAIKKENGYYTEDGVHLTSSTIREHYSDSNYIFEKQLVQEETLRQFNPDSVNTIRILTYKNKPISAAVRFGGKGDYFDNVSKGGVAVSIDLETGQLGGYGMRMYDINKYYEHPDSHVKFQGVVVPNWEKVIQTVEQSLSVLPYYKSVGFDIATTINGPVIVEINTGAGVNLSQSGKRIGIADSFITQ